MLDFLKGNCPKQDRYPFLRKEKLSEIELGIVERELQNEFEVMSTHFKKVIAETLKWYHQQDASTITPESLKSVVLTDLELDDLKLANSFEKVIEVLWENKKWSWFDFSLLKQMIDVYCQPDDLPKEQLQLYEKKFEEYCKRRVFECPMPIEGYSSSHDESILVVKFEIEFSKLKLFQLKKVTLEISRIINAQKVLKLLTIKDGCTELLFSLSKNATSKVFPLNSEQEELLAKIGVQQCCLYSDFEKEVSIANVIIYYF